MSYLLPSMTLTAKGRKLYGKAHSGECGIEFTKIVVGTGYIDSPDEAAALTALKNEVNATVNTLTIRAIDDSTVCISARITAADSPFYMREIGLFANDPDEGSILYGYCNFADTADYVETYKGLFSATQDIDIYIAVGNSANFSVDITEVVTATPKDVLDAEARLTAKIEEEAEARAATDDALENVLSGKSDNGHTHTELHTHINKTVLDEIRSGNLIRYVSQQTANVSAGLMVVYHTAAQYMPDSTHSYLVALFDESNIIPDGNSTWRLIACDLYTGKRYKGSGSIDSAYNDVFDHSITWTEI